MNPQQFIKDLIDEGYSPEEALEMAKKEAEKIKELMPDVIHHENNRSETWK